MLCFADTVVPSIIKLDTFRQPRMQVTAKWCFVLNRHSIKKTLTNLWAFTRNVKKRVSLLTFVGLSVCVSGQKAGSACRWTDEWCRGAADA